MTKIINVGLMAHVDAGKTTLAERILYNSGLVRQLGNVDKATSHFDYDTLEKKRGITIFSEQARINWKETILNIIDTPGHIDFSSDLYRIIKIVDVAVLIISAVEGIQSHTENIWKVLSKNKIPTLFYINKIDRIGADSKRVKEALKKRFTEDIISPFYLKNGKLLNVFEEDDKNNYEKILEVVALKDEKLMEKYLEGNLAKEESKKFLKDFFSKGEIYPVIEGSSINNLGVNEIFDFITDYYEKKKEQKNNLNAYVYKVKMDKKVGKLTFLKVLSGEISIRDTIKHKEEEFKVSQIRHYNGSRFQTAEKLAWGDVGAIVGLRNTTAGDFIGKDREEKNHIKTSILRSRILPLNEEERFELINALTLLNEEEPDLDFSVNEINKDLTVNVMGPVHLEVLEEVIKNRFNLEVKIENPRVNYMETIKKKSRGFCHYEPKKHYAELEVEIEPLSRGEGIKYTSELNTDELPSQFQNIIEKSVPEVVKHGIVLNAPLQDLHIKLIAGKHHLEHTHGGDFRIAFIRAVNKALENNIIQILEPLYEFEIRTSTEYSGKIMTDILRLNGTFEDPINEGDTVIIRGEGPVSKFIDYPIELLSTTSGRASISMKFSRYETCHNEEEVVADSNNIIPKDEKLYNSITIFREKKKMKKVK